MKKLTAFLKGPETTIELQDSILTTGNEYVFVKKASIFWEFINIKQDVSPAMSTVKYGSTSIQRGYYTFDDIAEVISKRETVLTRRNDGRCDLENTGTGDFKMGKVLCDLLGFYFRGPSLARFFNPGSYVSEGKSDINLGLRYINVSCNLVDTTFNYTNGRKSGVIVSLPITTSQSLFGSVSNYIDTESKIPVMKGAFNEVRFDVTDQDGSPVDVGHILIELYI